MKSKSVAHGEIWERYIRVECAELAKRGQAQVSKNWEAPRVSGTHVKRAESKPDFSGCIAAGRHVVFEAKATLEKERFDLKNLATHQRDHLLTASFMGALAFVYVLSGERRKYLIPMYVLEAATGASVRFDVPGVVEKLDGETWLDAAGRFA
jgi:penicillin-binding protein-related factor A (putative recombinase)